MGCVEVWYEGGVGVVSLVDPGHHGVADVEGQEAEDGNNQGVDHSLIQVVWNAKS